MSRDVVYPERDSAQPLAQPTSLLARVTAGEESAWQDLVATIHPSIEGMCKRRGYALGQGEHDVSAEVALRVVEQLQAKDFAAIRSFVATQSKYPQSKFHRWLGVLVHHAYIDFLRAQPEIRRGREGDQRSLIRTKVSSADVDGIAGQNSETLRVVEIRRLLLLMQEPDFPRDGRRAIRLWLEGHSLKEVASEMQLENADEAKRLLHAARQRLRRRAHKTPRVSEGSK